MKQGNIFWIASCVPDGGAYAYTVTPEGKTECIKKISMPSPMWLTFEDGRLWALLRAPFADSDESGVAAFDPRTGACIVPPMSTHGTVGCHMAIEHGDIYIANYVSGSLSRLPGGETVVHRGQGPDPVRQTGPHVHSVFFSPDKKYVLSCDLGLDTVFVYDRALKEVSRARVPAGHGVRHLVFSREGDRVFAVNEMGSSVTTFSWADGHLTAGETVSVLPNGYTGQNKASAIRLSPDGTQLYITNRGANTVARFAVSETGLALLDHTDTRGEEARDFRLLSDGRHAVCTDQFSDKVVLYRVGADGSLAFASEFPLPAPLAVEEIPLTAVMG